MKINRPLMNPTPRQIEQASQIAIEQEEVAEKTERRISIPVKNLAKLKPKKREKSQLSFNIDTKTQRLKQLWGSLKMSIKKRNEMIEVSALWKFPALPFFIVFYIANIFLFIFGIAFKYNDIPKKVPFFYDPVQEVWIQYDKIVLLIFPIALTAICAIQLQLVMSVFVKDRRLALTISWLMAFLNLLLFITFSQIYFLIT